MKILFLHSGDRVPSSRFRSLPVARRLRQMGHQCVTASSFPQKYEFFPWLGFRPSQLLKKAVRLWHLVRAWAGRYDVVVIDRELFDNDSVAMEALFRRIARSLVFDVDDAIFLRYPEKFVRLARMADHMIVGNRFLADYTRPYNDRITIIPTCIELDDYPRRANPPGRGARTIIGWIGTTANIPYLAVVAPALRRLAERCDFELRVVAGQPDPLERLDLAGVTIRFVPWHGATEVREILQFDIGLMPLPDDEAWTRYKCGLKLLQYMAVGIPAVASPVGVNAEIVQHGINGYLAASVSQWEETLESLLVDSQRRQRLGDQARRTVEARYSVAANAVRYVEAFEKAIRWSRSALP